MNGQERRRPTREDTRAALLLAAETLVRTQGFRVSVADIAAAAGLTKGAVYSNFSGRAELLEQVAERLLPPPLDVESLAPPGLPLSEGLAALARSLARQVDDRPQDVVLMLDRLAELLRDDEMRRRAEAVSQAAGDGGAGWLGARAQDEGLALPRSSADIAVVLDALAFGLSVTRLLRGADAVPEELFAWTFRRVIEPAAPV